MMGGQIGALLQMLMQQNPQAFQQVMQMMQQRQQQGGGAGIGSLVGKSPRGDASLIGGAPGGPMPFGPRPAISAGTIGGTTLDSYPRMGGASGAPSPLGPMINTPRLPPAPSSPVDTGAAWRGVTNWMPPAKPMPQPFPMPTVNRPPEPYRPPAYTPAPQTPPSPGAFSSPPPSGPSLAQNGTAGLDWYAMQAGN